MTKIAVIFAALIVLSGCSATSPTYSSLTDTTLNPKEGMAQLVIYRPESFKYFARALKIDLNGNHICDLANGTFFIKDTVSDKVAVQASLWGTLGTSRKTIRMHAGERYFVKVSVDNTKFSAGVAEEEAAGGPPGSIADLDGADDPSNKSGAFKIKILDKKTAPADLSALKLSPGCG